MKDAIELFAALGRRLRRFGSDEHTRAVIGNACCENGWFSEAEIVRAVGALAEDMLRKEALEAWLAPYPVPVARPQRVLVVMAGNIPLVGFFDLLCVVASGHRCLVKPSAKDRVLMEFIVQALREIDLEVRAELCDGTEPVDAVIATGGENAVRHFRTRYAGIPALLRGSRQSVAVLSGRETPEQLAGLADDIWAYSGLGCRSVSLLFVPEGCDLRLEMPAVNAKYRNNYRQTRALLDMTSEPYRDLGAAVLIEREGFPTALSEICVARYRSPEEVAAWLAAHDEEVQCVVTECLAHNRRAGFGRAQSPALTDYPDERDVIAFLVALNG